MKKLVALCLISGMLSTTVMNAQAANQEAEPGALEITPDYEVMKDELGNVYDLGGMEIIVRDWWTTEGESEPQNAYEEAKQEYLDWAMATYNFTIKREAISDWGNTPSDYVNYVKKGGDDNNYVFTLRYDNTSIDAIQKEMMYDLNSLSCLDFSQNQYQRNKIHEKFTIGDKVYAMNGDNAEPRTGLYFNKQVLIEAGIDPDNIYDMQANGTWTWDAWTEIMDKVQRDMDDDGVTDVWGFDAQHGNALLASMYSNGGEIVGKEKGKYTYALENPESIEAIEWYVNTTNEYAVIRPEDSVWDYYLTAFYNGDCAFMVEDAYVAGQSSFMNKMNEEVGFVMFPKGPQATDYVNCWNDHFYAIPACYDSEKAWKIAFAYDIYTSDVPGYEGYQDYSLYESHIFDERAKKETIPMMFQKGMVTYHSLIKGLDTGIYFTWYFYRGMTEVEMENAMSSARDNYKPLIDNANVFVNKIVRKLDDVAEESWQYKYVKKVMDLGIMNGKSEDDEGNVTFDPNSDLTRAEFVRSLYNKEGKPSNILYTDRFSDVKEGQWYTDAILWAADKGLVNGKKADYFDVNGKITREEIATILYKYAVMKKYNVSKQKDFSEYEDGASVSSWAVNYMKWALGNNIMKGQGSKIAPGARATRAEAATMLINFMSRYEGMK